MPLTKSLHLLMLVAGLSLSICGQDGSQGWKIQSPYPNNPLKQATLSGEVSHGALTSKAGLRLECRPDAQGPRLNLVLSPQEVKFDTDPFEGPGGLGERRKLRVALAKATWSHHFSGYYVESDTFEFSFALHPVEARQLASSSRVLTITIDPAKQGEPLQFRFLLPADGAAVREMVKPCIASHPKS